MREIVLPSEYTYTEHVPNDIHSEKIDIMVPTPIFEMLSGLSDRMVAKYPQHINSDDISIADVVRVFYMRDNTYDEPHCESKLVQYYYDTYNKDGDIVPLYVTKDELNHLKSKADVEAEEWDFYLYCTTTIGYNTLHDLFYYWYFSGTEDITELLDNAKYDDLTIDNTKLCFKTGSERWIRIELARWMKQKGIKFKFDFGSDCNLTSKEDVAEKLELQCQRGFPDLFVFSDNGVLAIELKVDNANCEVKHVLEQYEWGEIIKSSGCKFEFCFGLDDAKKKISNFVESK